MHRTDGAGNVAGMYVSEDLATNRPPTEMTADHINAVQEEICGVIEAAGLTLSKPDNTQMLQAIQTLIEAAASPAIPTGAVAHFAMATPPSGWIKANGAAVSRATYAALFAAIGTTFGVGDGNTTFNVPDLRGEFVRGWDDGRGIDVARVFGVSQLGSLQDHRHSNEGSYLVSGPANFNSIHVGSISPQPSNDVTGPIAQTGGILVAQETRPRNIALLCCIKY